MQFDIKCSKVKRLFKLDEFKDSIAKEHLVENTSLNWHHLRHLRVFLLSSWYSRNKCKLPHKRVVSEEQLGKMRRNLYHIGGASSPGQVLVLCVRNCDIDGVAKLVKHFLQHLEAQVLEVLPRQIHVEEGCSTLIEQLR